MLEATTNYRHIYDMCSAHLDVIVGRPPTLQAIAETDNNSEVDAKELSQLLWLASVPKRFVPTDEIRQWRDLVRTRISPPPAN